MYISCLTACASKQTLANSRDFNISVDGTEASGKTYTFMLTTNLLGLSMWPPPQESYFEHMGHIRIIVNHNILDVRGQLWNSDGVREKCWACFWGGLVMGMILGGFSQIPGLGPCPTHKFGTDLGCTGGCQGHCDDIV